MSRPIHFVTQNVPGYGFTDGRCLPYSGVSVRAVSLSPCSSPGHYITLSHTKTASLKCPSRGMSSACRASSSGYRRNPDNSRQNKNGYSRKRDNRHNDERGGSESLEESELFSSKVGPLLSASNAPKYQATSTPGPREQEILGLLRKVQAQIRENRAAAKEEKKTALPPPQARGEESEAVDSLVKLLRKHTTRQGKGSSSSGSSRASILDQPEPNGAVPKEKSSTWSDLNINVKDEVQGRESPPLSRPVSKFQRRSPVTRAKFQLSESDSVKDTWINGKTDRNHPEPEIHDPKLEIEPEPDFSDGEVFDEMAENEATYIDEGYIDVDDDDDDDDDVEEQKPIVEEELSAMKLTELRAIAKTRGLKGFSKLKKSQLVELLSRDSA